MNFHLILCITECNEWDGEKKKRYASIWRRRSNKKNIWFALSKAKYLKYFHCDRFFTASSSHSFIIILYRFVSSSSYCWLILVADVKMKPATRWCICINNYIRNINDERFITINSSENLDNQKQHDELVMNARWQLNQ